MPELEFDAPFKVTASKPFTCVALLSVCDNNTPFSDSILLALHMMTRVSSAISAMWMVKGAYFLTHAQIAREQWFDVIFDLKCDEPVMFSTGPHTTDTHWKQCAFYLSKPVDMQQGERMHIIVHMS